MMGSHWEFFLKMYRQTFGYAFNVLVFSHYSRESYIHDPCVVHDSQ